MLKATLTFAITIINLIETIIELDNQTTMSSQVEKDGGYQPRVVTQSWRHQDMLTASVLYQARGKKLAHTSESSQLQMTTYSH